ncbi:KAT8 regulatory NSL complex subunit 2 [Heracleum sosnowskyi]|uniref:KAT8 regulatory NSL complex subunit 2 n=1 Tax=Heracleum sosnowskyi TaxID=360622 RepID=A0AAD8IVV8_9APIA|nr:KAT8 regulatory NSL complex subunit 2 [Heracleum sosnowskyi]
MMASSSNNTNFPNFPNSTNPNSSHDSQMSNPSNSQPQLVDPDSALSNSDYLTRREVLSRRSRKLHQLTKLYKDQYWALMEELKNQHGEYYWEYGKSPFVQDDDDRKNILNNCENRNDVRNCNGVRNDNVSNVECAENNEGGDVAGAVFSNRCAVQGCKMKAMQLTQYCNMHILRDERQMLYKGCGYVIKSSQAGPILCSKPILRAAVPSLCTPHMQKAEKHVARALKKAGLSGHSTSKLAPQFHVIVAEYVNQIQAKRRAARKVKKEPYEVNEEEDISL